MTFSRPGPKRDDALSAIVGGKALDRRPDLMADEQQLLDEESPSSVGPSALQQLAEHERTRLLALGAGQRKVADEAIREVIGDLELLLDSAAAEVRAATGGRRTRKQVKKAAPGLMELDELPLVEAAELLGLRKDEVDGVLAGLAARGEYDRDQLLGHLAQLQATLREVRDHSMLSGLVGFVVKVYLLVRIPAAGDPLLAETIKTGITALAAIALQQAVETVRDWFAEREPVAVAQRAREDLLTELTLAKNLTKSPAYEGEHVVLRFRLHVRSARARVSTLPLDWPDKLQYWQLLDQIALALDHDAPKTLVLIRRKLESTASPSPSPGPS